MKCLLCFLFGHKNSAYNLEIGATKGQGKRNMEVLSCDRCYEICKPFEFKELLE